MTCNQPKCSSTDKWIKKIYTHTHTHTHTHTMEYYSTVKKNEILPFGEMWMDIEIIMLKEIRQRKANTISRHICGI